MKKSPSLYFLFSLLYSLVILGCENQNKTDRFAYLQDYQAQYAPDKRVALWNIEWDGHTLKGETNQIKGFAEFIDYLTKKNIKFKNEVRLLPDESLAENTLGIITLSVANIRSAPKHSAELATQSLLGTPVKVLKQENSWYLIQTPDKYISWVDAAGIQLMNQNQMNAYLKKDKVVYEAIFGFIYADQEEEEVVADLVAGNILSAIESNGEHIKVELPDGRTGLVRQTDCIDFETWKSSRELTPTKLISTAKSMMGVPYLWGGTSIKGLDCSGFTKTIYYLNGQVIPRDASQQINEGEEIDKDKSWENLEVGDLLFFGEKATDENKERVIHVGMWIGDNSFIHARGRVRISSFDPNSEAYDEYELNRYLRTKRVIGKTNPNSLDVEESLTFTNNSY